jgi:hypothetical protein
MPSGHGWFLIRARFHFCLPPCAGGALKTNDRICRPSLKLTLKGANTTAIRGYTPTTHGSNTCKINVKADSAGIALAPDVHQLAIGFTS